MGRLVTGMNMSAIAEDDRAPGARRRELDHAPVIIGEVGVEPPSHAGLKALGTINICNRENDDLEFHLDRLHSRCLGCTSAEDLSIVHVTLLWFAVLRMAGFGHP